jgi:type IV secretory pathway component VirB8
MAKPVRYPNQRAVSLSDDQLAAVRRIAEDDWTSEGAVIRRAVAEYISQRLNITLREAAE